MSSSTQQLGRGSRTGRPSKGDRVGLMVRVPRELAALFASDAAAAGVSQSDRMEAILSELYHEGQGEEVVRKTA